MKTIFSVVTILTFLFSSVIIQAQIPDELMKSFSGADWKSVKQTKQSIEDLQEKAIPDLIDMLESKEKVKLENTGSLIYPGAERFYGHGQILDYDVDYLNIRAGWLIEEITFNNFGFSIIHLPKDELISQLKNLFPKYYNNSTNRKKIESSSDADLRKIATKLSVDAAKAWWNANGTDWSRLTSLVEALQSFDEKTTGKSSFYMRNSTTKCDGLTREYYFQEISKEIVRLNSSSIQRISEHAGQILTDRHLEWLEMKTN
jgi:hypothetical protein